MVLGGERELVLTSILLAAVIGFSAIWLGYIWLLALVVFIEFGALSLFRMMGKRDPCMTQVFIRFLRYSSRYPSQSIPRRQ